MQHFTIIILVFFLNSCGTPQETSNSNFKDEKTLSGKYAVIALENEKPDVDLYIDFDSAAGKVSGFAGCNSFAGNYKTSGMALTLEALASTRKNCQNTLNAIENKILELLERVESFEIDDKNLILRDNSKAILSAIKTSQEIKSQISQTVTYEANTRGFYERIWISGNSLSFTNERYAKAVVSNTIPENDLEELKQLMDSLEPKILPNLEPPSKAFQYDGAAIATLKIKNDSAEYQTTSFDHGNPPERIKPLVKKILDLKKSMVD